MCNAEVEGQELTLVKDEVAISGERTSTADGSIICDIPAFDLITEAETEAKFGEMDLVVTEDCGLRTVEVKLTHDDADLPDSDSKFHNRATAYIRDLFTVSVVEADHGTELRGWAKAEINDGPGIDLAATYAEFEYFDNITSVDDAHNPDHTCDWFWLSGWRNDSCSGSTNLSASQPWAKTTGVFHNDFCPSTDQCSRTISSKYTAKKNFRWSHKCTFSRTDPPPWTHYRCNGGWETVD